MYRLLSIKNKEDFFLPVSKRMGRGIFFVRFIGFDQDMLYFLKRFQTAAQKKGLYLNRQLRNPTESEVQFFERAVSLSSFSCETSFLEPAIESWFSSLPRKQSLLFGDALREMLKLLFTQEKNKNIVKNAFVKFMCWAKYIFEGVLPFLGEEEPPKVLYEGEISKYEVYMLHILAGAGCDIAYVNFLSEESYLKVDKTSAFSAVIYGSRREIPKEHFSGLDISFYEKERTLQQMIQAAEGAVCTNTWIQNHFMEEIFKNNRERGASASTVFYNLYGKYLGVDNQDEYMLRIYTWRKKLLSTGRPFVMAEEKLGNPTIEEVKRIKKTGFQNKQELIYSLAMQIDFVKDTALCAILRRAFVNICEKNRESSLSILYNDSAKLLCWLFRYGQALFSSFSYESLPVFFFYGKCTEAETAFLELLASAPIDVLLFSTDKELYRPACERAVVEELENSVPFFAFPKKEPKVRIATTAYRAEQELNEILYQNTGLFRNRQFLRSVPVTLKTTYEEISILWKQEAKYRPGFQADEEKVQIPNLFAKVCGVEEGNISAYFRKIGDFITEKTIFLKKFPYIREDAENPIKPFIHQFFEKGEIKPEKIKAHKVYQYDYVSEDTQNYMLEKIQQMLEMNFILFHETALAERILATTLYLDKMTVRLIQQFDFTREIPKLLALDVDESMCSPEDCIYLLFLNLIGFDIVIFTPTGYRNIEKYISSEAFETYQAGPYLFHLQAPDFRSMAGTEGNLFSRLFRKGRG